MSRYYVVKAMDVRLNLSSLESAEKLALKRTEESGVVCLVLKEVSRTIPYRIESIIKRSPE